MKRRKKKPQKFPKPLPKRPKNRLKGSAHSLFPGDAAQEQAQGAAEADVPSANAEGQIHPGKEGAQDKEKVCQGPGL